MCQAILTDGIDNVRFIVPLNIVSMGAFGINLLNGSDFKDTLCKIKESYNHEVKNNYKLTVIPVEKDETVASHRDFYTSDMLSLIESGHIKIVA